MRLSARVLGEGRPIVLLPGFALDSTVMAAACEPVFGAATAPSGWQRIYLDLPGTGGSAAGEPTSEAVLTAVRSTVADLIGDTPYLLVGHSYGGYLATGLVRRAQRQRQRQSQAQSQTQSQVAGLFVICAGLRIRPGDRDLSGVLPSLPEPGWLDGVPEDLHQHFGQAIGRQTRAVADRIAELLGRRGQLDQPYLDALRPEGYRLGDEPGPQTGSGPQGGSGSFTGPVGLLAGRRDRIAGCRDVWAALGEYPGGSFTALARAGHYLPFEEPEAFAASILGWLASVARSTPS